MKNLNSELEKLPWHLTEEKESTTIKYFKIKTKIKTKTEI